RGEIARNGRPKKGGTNPPFPLARALGVKSESKAKDISRHGRRLLKPPDDQVVAYVERQKGQRKEISKAGLIRFATGTEKAGRAALTQVRSVILPAAVTLRGQIAERGDLAAARQLCRGLEAYRKYLQDREGRDLLAAECRRTEKLIGKLLGPAPTPE